MCTKTDNILFNTSFWASCSICGFPIEQKKKTVLEDHPIIIPLVQICQVVSNELKTQS